ncbi:bacitracin ABC transporter permease [Mangrovimicrobium sediminis]|uniref:Bacitracin ABC transporter permease n=2 Tax=Mangrovimicrobium sediminis TaxID=2562682 RepID=A0A4Z0M005_9GAMM|nr:lysophospholipid acyltransferase family protein [Haliea sp. SAOS-164]TGD72810.1 bacitracin ABC transporter permease [Haliea sp. SAOS-164]
MNALKAALVKLFLHGFALLPLGVSRAVGRTLAAAYWQLNGAAARVTRRNIELAFPHLAPAERDALARDSLLATGELAAEMGWVWLRPWPVIAARIESVEGAQLVTEALAAGSGVVILAPHIGNWEVLGLHLATLGPTVSLFEPPHLVALEPVMRRARERSGATLVPTDSRGLARLLRSVRQGGIAGILPDQVPRSLNAGENVEFMGVRCFTPTLACQMIRRSGATAVVGTALRTARGFRVIYTAAEPDVASEDIHTALQAMNRGVAAAVAQAPAQYQWEYKRFKVRPREGRDVYHDL